MLSFFANFLSIIGKISESKLGFNCLQTPQNLFKSPNTLIKCSSTYGDCSLTVEYEPVEFFLGKRIYRTLGTRVRLPPIAFKLLQSNSFGVSQMREWVRLAAEYTCSEESENRMFSEPPIAFELIDIKKEET